MKSIKRLQLLVIVGPIFVTMLGACTELPTPTIQATPQETLIPLHIPGEENCLWLDDRARQARRVMVNLITGEQIETDLLPLNPLLTYPSPDRRYAVVWGGENGPAGLRLLLQSAGEEYLFIVQNGGYPGDPRSGYGQGSAPSPMPYPFPVQWSPDSRRFAYIWKEGESYYTSIFDVQTRRTDYTAENDAPLTLEGAKPGWSLDSAAYVFHGFEGGDPALRIWSAATLAVVQSIPGAMAVSEWSPDERFAYVRRDDTAGIYWLGYASLSQTSAEIRFQQDQTGPLNASWSAQWSPDARYLALRSYGHSHGLDLGSNLAVFSQDADIVPLIVGIIGPQAQWLPDGQTFLYLQRRGAAIRVRDLVAYRIEGDTAALKILLRNVYSFSLGQTRLAAIQPLDDFTGDQIVLMDLDGIHQQLVDFGQVKDVIWLDDTLVYVSVQGDQNVVHWTDREDQTGQVTIPREGATGVWYVNVFPAQAGKVLITALGQPDTSYLLNLEDGTLTSLGSASGWPVWAPDYSRIAVISDHTLLIIDANQPVRRQRITIDRQMTSATWIPCP